MTPPAQSTSGSGPNYTASAAESADKTAGSARASAPVDWARVLSDLPLIAILRGLTPPEALPIAGALHAAGFLCLEVPLNSPDAFQSIAIIRANFGERLLVGAGTVLSVVDVRSSKDCGAQLIVSPNTEPRVIGATKTAGLISVPGFVTPSEGFTALASGADALKLFPAEAAPAPVLRAMKAVLPSSVPVVPVGGITPSTIPTYRRAGAAGFGIGSALYSPGTRPELVQERAAAFIQAWRDSRP